MTKHSALVWLLFTMTAGCTGMTAPAGDPAATASNIAAAVAHPGRTQQDRAKDASRRPADVLAFFGITRSMKVLDLYSGGGYYTEIMARAVGDGGIVYTQNNAAYVAYAKDEIDQRYDGHRLPNVRRVLAENNELDFPPAFFDAALLILAYHDIYYVDEARGWPRIDGPGMLAEIRQSLKPGGVFGVVDHVAAAGAPAEAGATLHRIDPARLRREIVAAGFVFEAESDVLRNPEDQLDKPMFDPEVRGNTDRVVYRFRRP